MTLEIPLKSQTRNAQVIEASHLINMVDVLCRLDLIEGNIKEFESMIYDGKIRIYFYE